MQSQNRLAWIGIGLGALALIVALAGFARGSMMMRWMYSSNAAPQIVVPYGERGYGEWDNPREGFAERGERDVLRGAPGFAPPPPPMMMYGGHHHHHHDHGFGGNGLLLGALLIGAGTWLLLRNRRTADNEPRDPPAPESV